MRLFFSFAILMLIFNVAWANSTDQPNHSVSQVVAIADIHFTPFADCPAKNCVLIAKLNQADAAQWPQILSQYSHNTLPISGQETNYTLFHSLLVQIQQEQPKNVLILGDFLAHRYHTLYVKYSHDYNRNHYNKFVINTLKYLTDSIQQVLPADGAIYPVIGNNDSYGGKGCAYSDYCVVADGSFYRELAGLWSSLFRNDYNKAQFLDSFPHAGYYEIVLPNTHNHIIVLNTVLFSHKAQGPDIDQQAQKQLAWFEQKLQKISDAKEKTWVIFHIPPGIDAYSTAKNFFGVVIPFWESNYSKPFSTLIHQYNPAINAVLSGHLHMDGFLILDMGYSSNIIIDTFVPSISPVFGNNPSYKIYTYSNQEFKLHNFATYYLNLKSNASPTWQKEYDFSATYQPNDGLSSGYKKVTADSTNPFSASYIQFYSINTFTQPINNGKWNFYWCATNILDTQTYQACLKNLNQNS